MARNKENKSWKNPRSGNFEYQKCEPRNLLAGDVVAAPFEPATILDPFADNAVTVQQMLERAEHRPYREGELVVAVEFDGQPGEADGALGIINWGCDDWRRRC